MHDTFQHPGHPVLILIRGLPGSGKTHLAGQLQSVIGAENVVMLDPDAIDYESKEYAEHVKAMAAEGVDEKIYPFRFSKYKAFAGITSGKVIIWNQPFTNSGMFGRLIDSLKAYAAERSIDLQVVVVEVEVDPEVAQDRVAQRKQTGGHGPSDGTLTRYAGDYESLPSDGYTTVSVNGQGDVALSVDAVLKAI